MTQYYNNIVSTPFYEFPANRDRYNDKKNTLCVWKQKFQAAWIVAKDVWNWDPDIT